MLFNYNWLLFICIKINKRSTTIKFIFTINKINQLENNLETSNKSIQKIIIFWTIKIFLLILNLNYFKLNLKLTSNRVIKKKKKQILIIVEKMVKEGLKNYLK